MQIDYLHIKQLNLNDICAIDDSNTELSYGDLLKKSEEFKKLFTKGSLIFHIAANTIDSLIAHYSFMNNDLVSLILNYKTDKKLLYKLIEIYKPNYIVIDESFIQFTDYNENIFAKYNNLKIIYLHNEQIYLNNELEFLISTSGTTGSPKLVKFKKGNLLSNCVNVSESLNLRPDDVALINLPISYIMGLNVMLTQLYLGGKVVLTEKNITTLDHWSLLNKHKVTYITGVPFMYDLMDKLKIFNMKFETLRCIFMGGGKSSDTLFIKILEYCKNNNLTFYSTFGTTETSARMMAFEATKTESKIGSIGKPMKYGESFLIDPNGIRINNSYTLGELVYEGPNVALGYSSNIADLEKGDEFNGIYRTGDLALFDNEGFYYIKGRLKRFIKIQGIRIGLDELENILKEEYLMEFAVAGNDSRLIIAYEDEFSDKIIKEFIFNLLNINKTYIKVIKLDRIPRLSNLKPNYLLLNESF